MHHVIAGIGVNLNGAADAFPPELAAKATSLRLASGAGVDRAAFTAGLLAALEARYRRFLADGFAAMRSEWEARSSLTGKEVRVTAPEGEVAGRVLGIDDDGALRLAGPRGELRVVGGEVTLSGGYRSDGQRRTASWLGCCSRSTSTTPTRWSASTRATTLGGALAPADRSGAHRRRVGGRAARPLRRLGHAAAAGHAASCSAASCRR